MGDEEDNFRRLELAESLQEVLASIMVEPGGGFVKEEHRGIGGQGASQSQTLPLPHAELRATVEEAAEECFLLLGQFVDEGVGTGEKE